jgi:hypothetical protein
MAIKVTNSKKRQKREKVKYTTSSRGSALKVARWWKSASEAQRAQDLISTAIYLKDTQDYKYRQAAIYSRLYSNSPIIGPSGGTLQRTARSNQLPVDRPTMNVVQSVVDTVVSRISQNRPRPVFLTDNGDYRSRSLGKQMNDFIQGEFHKIDAYELGTTALRDAAVLGTGCLKIYEKDQRVCAERVLMTEILVDPNDGMYGTPQQMYQVYLVNREILLDSFPDKHAAIMRAEQAYPENSPDSTETVADQVMVVEGWHLPSGKDAKDGRHTIAVGGGALLDEQYDRDYFPFVFLHYSPRVVGFFGQSLSEQLMGTQMEINKLLITISRSINLMGVPRIFIEDGSKVVKQHFNNEIGSMITYRGVKPQMEVAPSNHPEIYQQLQRLIEYAYQQPGVNSLSAAGKKPGGLDAAVALREYDDLQTDRLATLQKRYEDFYIDLAYRCIDMARGIAERDGKYATVYPNRDGTRELDLPEFDLINDVYVIQAYSASALPKDPAGRMQKVTEMIQAGMIDIREGRRLLDYPDLEQNEKLENASEERIFQILDAIVEDGEYTPPDEFMDLGLAKKLVVQYYNLYMAANLEPDKGEMLRLFSAQVDDLMQASQPPAMMAAPQVGGLAEPEPLPTSPLVPQTGQ